MSKRRRFSPQAVDEMNGKELDGKVIYVGRAQKRLERQGELKRKFDQIRRERFQRYQVLKRHTHTHDICCKFLPVVAQKFWKPNSRSLGNVSDSLADKVIFVNQ